LPEVDRQWRAVPGSADIGCGIERLYRQSLLAQQIQLVKPSDAGTDYGGVELQRRFCAVPCRFDRYYILSPPS
jgi:hypothetical protein